MQTATFPIPTVGTLKTTFSKLMQTANTAYRNPFLPCTQRGFLISGGEVNTERTANMLIDEFRQAKIGRITLDEKRD